MNNNHRCKKCADFVAMTLLGIGIFILVMT